MAFGLGFEFRQSDGGLEGVFDLAAVPRGSFGFLQSAIVAFGVLDDALDVGVEIVSLLDQSVEVHFPDLHGGFFVEGRVVEGDVDAGFEGLVEMTHFVGGEEEDAGVVLQDAQEDGHHGVTAHVFLVSGLEEHVCFIKQ